MNRNWIFAACLAAVAAAMLFVRKGGNNETDPRLFKSIGEGLDLAAVDRIEISKGDAKLELAKQDNSWVVVNDSNYPADASKIVSLYDDLNKAKFIRVVSADPTEELQKEVGLAEPSVLSFKTGDSLAFGLEFGSSRDKGGQHVRVSGQKAIYLADQNSTLHTETADWEMKRILDIDGRFVRKLAFTPGKGVDKKPVTLSRDKAEDSFKVSDLPVGKQEKTASVGETLANLLKDFSYLKRVSTDNVGAANALKDPSQAVVEIEGGALVDLAVGSYKENPDSETKTYYLSVAIRDADKAAQELQHQLKLAGELGGKWLFEVSSYQAGKFEKGLEELIEDKSADAPKKADEAKTTNLEGKVGG